ncbi:putative glycosyltransferase [Golden Marseillevirus]|uniref:putative glycosyltransferase n=1 Tax=Golden Marseillevirus TaxID=1720526 RepID=UPI000877AB02|nr:putative glycosyltransferase [Golden Marseillevirus]ALX27556.1 putative glycosyltransferase [Golden Marseillevirus]
MQTTYRQVKSLNGVDDDILKSGIQKYIRRNKQSKALWCMVELDSFAEAVDERAGEAIRSNMIHRLMIIFLEEISICNLSLWIPLFERFNKLFSLRNERKGMDRETERWEQIRNQEKECLVWIVCQMCHSRHIRILSHTRSAFGHGKSKQSLEVAKAFYPEFYDIIQNFGEEGEIVVKRDLGVSKETEETKGLCDKLFAALSRGSCSAFYWTTKIFDLEKVKARYYKSQKAEFLVYWVLQKFFETRENSSFLLEIHNVSLFWFRELSNLREKFLPPWSLVALCVFGWQERHLLEKLPLTQEVYQRNQEHKISIDDYVVDKHTKQGRSMKKDSRTFVLEGAHVVREAKIGHPLLRQFYEDMTIYRESGIRGIKYARSKYESQVFSPIVRAQLVTGTGKTDTYFAIEKETGKRVLVKGPFAKKESTSNVLAISRLKKKLGLAYVPVRTFWLKPDLFPDCVLGIRAKIQDKETPRYFLAFEDQTTEEVLPITTKSGKVTPETKVVDWSKVESMRHFNPLECEEGDVLLQFCKSVIFRFILGIPDLADRNFLFLPEKKVVISIDEDVCDREFDIEASLKKNRYKKYLQLIKENKDEIQEMLELWKEELKTSKLPESMQYTTIVERMNKIF